VDERWWKGEPEAMDLDDDEVGDASIEKSTSSSDFVNSNKKLLCVSWAKAVHHIREHGRESEFWAHLNI
jgi:hypothetical protein